MYAFVNLMDEFEGGLSLYLRNPDMVFEPLPEELYNMRKQLLQLASALQIDAAAAKCDCGYCQETTARSLMERSWQPCDVAWDLRGVAATLCRPPKA